MNRIQLLAQQINQTSTVYTKINIQISGKVGIIYLNSPKDLNALNTIMKNQIVAAFLELENNPTVKSIVLFSKLPKAFCAGADIKEMIEDYNDPNNLRDTFHKLHNSFNGITKPIIAGVNGVAFGGGLQLAFCADMIVFSDDAKIGLPEVKLGLMPGIGGTQQLGRLIGKNLAMIHALTGQPITAAQLKQWGSAYVFPRDQLESEVLKIANNIAQKSSRSINAIKLAVNTSQQLGVSMGSRYERSLFIDLTQTEGAKQGMRAFVQKRKPNFK